MSLQPLSDGLVVERLEEETTTPSGIVLPDSAKEKPQKGKVLAVGPGKMNSKGERNAMTVNVGDTVLFSKYGPSEIKHDGKELLFLNESDVLAVVS
ncbi:co-chaperone GroES [Candidatus Peregrinibacteria bacterium]|jgi:chaperonin GroES|nr:co-chaperone GroES [Candidatus Peregrinibacteria bacterium]MBT7484117.1 co-chaperone GroES [Candidatus Peregrinibacteria bacterium]MBT7703232.1 co-chaperone GroES [Candidatus Peregrinibacteria bacterium]